MRNQTNNVFKVKRQKSKLFLIILCVFGLLFSYSCQCKNNVSDPNNIPPDNGMPGETDTGDTINDGDLTTNSTRLIRVSGDTVKISATIEFKNATATLKSFEDTDSTTLTDGDIVYEGTTLTLKADTTDASKIDTTVGGKITWEKASKKITATFTLTPAENVTLSETEKTVVIEIYKEKLLDVQKVIGETLVQDASKVVLEGGGNINFYTKSSQTTTKEYSTCSVDYPSGADSKTYSKSKFVSETIDKITKSNDDKGASKIPLSKIEFVSDKDAGGGTHSFTFKFYFSDADYDLEDSQKNGIEYRLDVLGGQTAKGNNKFTWTE